MHLKYIESLCTIVVVASQLSKDSSLESLKLQSNAGILQEQSKICKRTCRKEGPSAQSLDQPVMVKACLTPLGRQRHANLKSVVGPKILPKQNLLVTKESEIEHAGKIGISG